MNLKALFQDFARRIKAVESLVSETRRKVDVDVATMTKSFDQLQQRVEILEALQTEELGRGADFETTEEIDLGAHPLPGGFDYGRSPEENTQPVQRQRANG